mmetsp:Transcript_37188/g.47410  ORF Transcript_37188/g.47410 Transcript_37188/m.47410 type:complete len:360 (+) Transcript_37188:2-1081(+)
MNTSSTWHLGKHVLLMLSKMKWILCALIWVLHTQQTEGFVNGFSSDVSKKYLVTPTQNCRSFQRSLSKDVRSRKVSTMLFGPAEDFFGIGTPEAIVILGVGWFVLGPTELYKLTKELGGIIGNLREAVSSITKGVTESIEKEIGVKELEKNFYEGKLDLDDLWGNTGEMAGRPDMNDFVDKKVSEMNFEQNAVKTPVPVIPPEQNSTVPANSLDREAMNEKFSAQLDIDEWNKSIMAAEKSVQVEEENPEILSYSAEMQKVTKEVEQEGEVSTVESEELLMRKLQALADLEEEKMLEMQQREQVFVDEMVRLKMEALAALEKERVQSLGELEERYRERRDFIEEMFAPLSEKEKNSTVV